MRQNWTYRLAIIGFGASSLGAQTGIVDLTNQASVRKGSQLPVHCNVGQFYILTSAPEGANLYLCSSANTWKTVGIPALGGDAAGTALGLTVQGIQGRGVAAAAPADRDILRWDMTSGKWTPAAPDLYLTGEGIAITSGTISIEDAVVPVYYTGSAAPTMSCVSGRDFYVDTTAGTFYFCKGPSGWQAAASTNQANAFGAGKRQSVAHDASTAGLRLVPVAGDPSGAVNGDLWYNSTSGKFRRLQNGVAMDWDMSGGVSTTQANAFGAGLRQTVSHDAFSAGLRLAPAAGDPSNTQDGDLWYNLTTGRFRRKQNGAVSDWDSSSGPAAPGSVNLATGALLQEYLNDATTGSVAYQLVTGYGSSKQVRNAGTATSGVIGVCLAGCGTSGTAQIGIRGRMTCSFSNATTAWNYVQADGATGKCKDVGAAFPTSGGQIIGQVLETGAAGNREIRFGSEPQPGGGSSTTAVYAGHYYPFGDYTAAAATSAATSGRVYYFRFTPPLDVPVSTLIPVLLAGSSSTYVAMAFMDGNCNKVAGSDVRVTGLTTSLYYYPTHPATDPLTLAAGNEYYFAVVGDGAYSYQSYAQGSLPFVASGIADNPYFYGSTAATGSGATLAVPSSCGSRTRLNDNLKPTLTISTRH